MKKVIFFITTILLCCPVAAQEMQDSVDIQKIVSEQIAIAREKEKQENQKMVAVVYENGKNESKAAPIVNYSGYEEKNASPLKIKILILLIASFFAASVVVVRRKIIYEKNGNKKQLKKNIKLLREERIFKIENPHLKTIRMNLKNDPACYDFTGIKFSKKARELKISTGELMLATRIKSHELAKACSLKN